MLNISSQHKVFLDAVAVVILISRWLAAMIIYKKNYYIRKRPKGLPSSVPAPTDGIGAFIAAERESARTSRVLDGSIYEIVRREGR